MVQPEAPQPSVCVVGAGIAGLTAARRLKDHGFAVRLFGYSGHRRLAGRLHTEAWDLRAHRMDGPRKVVRGREAAEHTARFDTGCQWLSGQEPRFLAELARWRSAGAVEEWTGAVFGSVGPDGAFKALMRRTPVWCGLGGNARIVEHIAEDLGVENITYHIAQRFVKGRAGSTRYALEYEEVLAQNHLDFVGGNLPMDRATQKTAEDFDYVVLAHGLGTNQPRMVSFEDPAAQQVLEGLKKNVRWQTLHALTLAFKEPLRLPFDVCRIPEAVGQGLALVVHASAKPGMRTEGGLGPDVWTLFPSAEVAREYAKPKDSKACQQRMMDRFFAVFGVQAFRKHLLSDVRCPFGLIWPHGQCTTKPPGEKTRALFSPETRVGVCADYAGGAPCVEAAVVSALELADALAAHAKGRPLPDTVLTNLTREWVPISRTLDLPWVIAHFPGLPAPPECLPLPPVPVSWACCPTHDPLGAHPGLVFGRTAALKPWERERAERGEKVRGLDVSEFLGHRTRACRSGTVSSLWSPSCEEHKATGEAPAMARPAETSQRERRAKASRWQRRG